MHRSKFEYSNVCRCNCLLHPKEANKAIIPKWFYFLFCAKFLFYEIIFSDALFANSLFYHAAALKLQAFQGCNLESDKNCTKYLDTGCFFGNRYHFCKCVAIVLNSSFNFAYRNVGCMVVTVLYALLQLSVCFKDLKYGKQCIMVMFLALNSTSFIN